MPGFSNHARDQMAARQVTEGDVQSALNRRHGQPRPGDNGNIVVLGYASLGRILKVVLSPDQQDIVTVMWLDG